MPILGCIKGCGSCNPCPICDIKRTKEGRTKAEWLDKEQVNLLTLGSLYENYTGWVIEGEKQSAVGTSKWKCVSAPPLIPFSQGRKYDDLILTIVVPGPLHLFLSFNEIVNYLEQTQWPQVKDVLKNVIGAQFHMYMGKVGNYEGPNIHKIFQNLTLLEPYMLGGSWLQLYYRTFVAFKDVAHTVFSEQDLDPNWREKLHHLSSCIIQLNTQFGMSITPKLHIFITHIEQCVDIFQQTLGREGEQQGEAVHHIWRRLLESQGEPKVKEGPAFTKFILQSLFMFNAHSV